MRYEEELMDIGVKHERERIIQIIEQQDWNGHYWNEKQDTANCKCRDCEDVRALVASIKGENK